ncbi:glycosyltransferase family 2 protein [Tardiphaga robiniae]|uniref:Glycosyltransferase family 2 protein n=1 Tax=Tardiphaga robiniae TaxID=943830 RepID=A0A7G6TUB1_9BRAD|nr:glycosyltransferase family A protein [Tardiphaga robiniae]QND70343.1 glycosyltransferase family 2 protein [Tardiphaga robiniae]
MTDVLDQLVEERSPRLSVVMPNFNHGAVIGNAIRALVAQVPPADEIIVVDDGSTDDSLAVLEGLAQAYASLRIVSLPRNGGAIAALNRGLHEARGTYVYFGAADDLTLPGLFGAMLDGLTRYPEASFACCEAIVHDVETGERSPRPPVRPSYSGAFLAPAAVASTLLHIDNWILTGTVVVRRDAMLAAGGFDAKLGAFADSFVFRRLSLQTGCYFAPVRGLIWRASAGGLSRSQAADPAAAMQMIAAAQEQMRRDPVFPTWYPAVFERRWRFAIGRIAALARPMNRVMLAHLGRGPLGRTILTSAAALGGSVGSFTALAWLTLQERPTSFSGLLRTRLARTPRAEWPQGK